MKGVTREKVSLTIGNYIFRERKKAVGADGVFFSCNGCEKQARKHLSAIAKINEDGSYELIEWPRLKDHSCWADGSQAVVQKARRAMIFEVSQDPSRSVNLRGSEKFYHSNHDHSGKAVGSLRLANLQSNSINFV